MVESTTEFDALTKAISLMEELEERLEDFPNIKVLGTYPTLADLLAAHPDGSGLDGGYFVVENGEFYIWSTVTNQWESLGTIKGPKGDQGPQGEQGPKGDKPAHEWQGTSLRFENPDGSWGQFVNLKGQDGTGAGDMLKSTYDTNDDGKVDAADNADKLGGIAASLYALKSYVDAATTHKAETMQYEGWKYKINNPYENGGSLALKGQLHCHTTNSDGEKTPYELGVMYKNAGYDFLSITDHDFITPDPGIEGLTFFTGVEETSIRHITAYDIDAHSTSTDVQTIIDFHNQNGKICSIAHPNLDFAGRPPINEDEMIGYIDHNFIEVWNYPNTAEDQWDNALTAGKKVFAIAVDDYHGTTSTPFNCGWVVVFTNENNKNSILQALRDGNFYASTGNDISVSVSGNVVTATSTELSNISFIGKNGTVLQTNNGVTSATYTIRGDEMYIRVKSEKIADSTYAWAQPIFIDYIGGDYRASLFADKIFMNNFPKSNLLINSDFRNPINQRGEDVYTTSAEITAIDRWNLLKSPPTTDITATYTVSSRELKVVSGDGWASLTQIVENPEKYAGKTVNFSVEIESCTALVRISFWYKNKSTDPLSGVAHMSAPASGSPQKLSTSWRVPVEMSSTGYFKAVIQVNNGSAILNRAKLEMGNVSTLENDPPANYGEQLALCQRYCLNLSSSTQFLRAERVDANTIYFTIPTPVTLRANPVLYSGAIKIYNFSNNTEATGFSFTYTNQNNAIRVAATKTGHGLTDAYLHMSGAIFSAD